MKKGKYLITGSAGTIGSELLRLCLKNGAKKIKTFNVVHEKRKFGFTKYGMIKKVFFALPEFIYFFYRLKIGCFKI